MEDVNIKVWYSTRELKRAPPHFIKCSTPVTVDSHAWIRNSLTGRYSLQNVQELDATTFSLLMLNKLCPYFEDSGEAMMYELRWSGDK